MDNEGKSNPFSHGFFKALKMIKRYYLFAVALAILFAIALNFNYNDKSAYFFDDGSKEAAETKDQSTFGYIKNTNLNPYIKTFENYDKITNYLRIEKPSVITVDGRYVATLKNKKDALDALQMILDKYKKGSSKAYFKNDVRIVEKDLPIFNIETVDEAVKDLEKLLKEPTTYTVMNKDSLWSISRKYKMKIDDIYKLNPGLTENIMPGQVIILSKSEPQLTIVTEKKIVYIDDIPYETVTQKGDTMYINSSRKIKNGEKGYKLVTAILEFYNGDVANKKVINEEVIEKPVDEIVAVGSKVPPRTNATGTFDYPIRGYITSRYGQRWGKLHAGIDIAGSTGDPIYAADGGTVIFSGWESGYGYLVKIDHGNGYVTYYGHSSKLLVNAGDKVYKGQKIALIGSTGHTTGPHLHFEVRKNGVPVNPLLYLK